MLKSSRKLSSDSFSSLHTELSSSLQGPPIPKMNHAGRAGKKSQRVYMVRPSGGGREAEGVLYSNSNSALQKVHTVTREIE